MVRMIVLRLSTALAVAITAGAVLVATGSSATANNGDPVIAGQANQATATTGISNLVTGGDGLYAFGKHYGVYGSGNDTGVFGAGPVNGVFGLTSTGNGVYGSAPNGNGVWGQTSGFGVSGVYGENDGNGYGVAGRSATGVGVFAESAGTALQVLGRSTFTTAGTAVIASGKKSVTVTLAGVTTTDFVLATVQGSGSFYVKNASAGSGSFTIYINKAPTSPNTVTVAYFVISAS
jgi:hypothetical protein